MTLQEAIRQEAIREADIAEAYHDGYTACVVDNRDGEVYTLSIQSGGMPPHFSKDCQSLDEAISAMAGSHFPDGIGMDICRA